MIICFKVLVVEDVQDAELRDAAERLSDAEYAVRGDAELLDVGEPLDGELLEEELRDGELLDDGELLFVVKYAVQ